MWIPSSPILHVSCYRHFDFLSCSFRSNCQQCFSYCYCHNRIICKSTAFAKQIKFLCFISSVKLKWTSYNISQNCSVHICLQSPNHSGNSFSLLQYEYNQQTSLYGRCPGDSFKNKNRRRYYKYRRNTYQLILTCKLFIKKHLFIHLISHSYI